MSRVQSLKICFIFGSAVLVNSKCNSASHSLNDSCGLWNFISGEEDYKRIHKGYPQGIHIPVNQLTEVAHRCDYTKWERYKRMNTRVKRKQSASEWRACAAAALARAEFALRITPPRPGLSRADRMVRVGFLRPATVCSSGRSWIPSSFFQFGPRRSNRTLFGLSETARSLSRPFCFCSIGCWS